MYYVLPFTRDKIRLVSQKFELDEPVPSVVDITVGRNGTLSKINPLVELNKYSPLKFDLSDSSLSFQSGVTPTSAFKLDLYKDGKFGEKYFTNGKEVGFAVTTGGSPGIDANAHLTLTIDDNTPSNLWYKFNLNSIDDISAVKKELIIDKDVDSYNQINLGDVTVKQFGNETDFIIKFEKRSSNDPNFIKNIKNKLSSSIGNDFDFRRVENVGPKVSLELLRSGIIAICLSLAAMLIYIWIRFEWQFSVGAITAVFHDVVITLGFISLLNIEIL